MNQMILALLVLLWLVELVDWTVRMWILSHLPIRYNLRVRVAGFEFI